jgi:hypothetical protein
MASAAPGRVPAATYLNALFFILISLERQLHNIALKDACHLAIALAI